MDHSKFTVKSAEQPITEVTGDSRKNAETAAERAASPADLTDLKW